MTSVLTSSHHHNEYIKALDLHVDTPPAGRTPPQILSLHTYGGLRYVVWDRWPSNSSPLSDPTVQDHINAPGGERMLYPGVCPDVCIGNDQR